ncbi:MAG TPA: hypothetical protein VHG33_11815, partial [Woeseiaceae bacterium]|nr:hypothetical protein [Woeseiaceae bacterium]
MHGSIRQSCLAILCLGLLQGASAAEQASAPRYEVAFEEASIPMPDGVRLAADLFVPAGAAPGERFPV